MRERIALTDGAVISHSTGAVQIRLTCVRAGQAYRVAVCYGSTGIEIPELCASYPSEVQARRVARAMSLTFRTGVQVREVVGVLALLVSEALACTVPTAA